MVLLLDVAAGGPTTRRTATLRWQGAEATSGFGLAWIASVVLLPGRRPVRPVVPVHHDVDPFGRKEPRGVGRARDGGVDGRPLVGIEPGQHVVGEVAPKIAASDPHAQPREVRR